MEKSVETDLIEGKEEEFVAKRKFSVLSEYKSESDKDTPVLAKKQSFCLASSKIRDSAKKVKLENSPIGSKIKVD